MKNIFMPFLCLLLTIHFAGAHELSGSKVFASATVASWFIGSPAIGITVAGGNGGGSAANQLSTPFSAFVDQAGNVYVADVNNQRIARWAPGALSGVTVAGGNGSGSAANQLASPSDVFVDQAGNIYIADYNNHRIQKWAPGALSGVTVAGGNGQGSAANQLNFPSSFYVDPASNVYIGDFNNHRIQKWAPGALSGVTVAGGNGPGSATNQLASPFGVFVDPSGNIYVADYNNHRIQKWAQGAASGITVAGGKGPGSADDQFNLPIDLFVDQSGNIFVADAGNNRIQKWAPGAASGSTVAGGNGRGSAANQLASPSSVFVDQVGNIYVNDQDNHRVQQFRPDPSIACLPNLSFTVASCTGTTAITWTAPADTFPTTINIPEELDPSWGTLAFMGTLSRHGYYRSAKAYPWPVANDITKYLGDTGVNGHLITIGSADENNFIYSRIAGSDISPWIGLYNSGKPGQFQWVTGEPLVYAKWAPGEPNNGGMGLRFVKEPYVRFLSAYNTWNDQPADDVPFIAEFEAPLTQSRQISGPANGSRQGPGNYQVCYERTNRLTGLRDTCCFSITVSCNTTSVNGFPQGISAVENPSMYNAGKGMRVAVAPNPSSRSFWLYIENPAYTGSFNVQVTDVTGKRVESRKGIMPGQALELGTSYKQGVYFAQVKQGTRTAVVKLIKQ